MYQEKRAWGNVISPVISIYKLALLPPSLELWGYSNATQSNTDKTHLNIYAMPLSVNVVKARQMSVTIPTLMMQNWYAISLELPWLQIGLPMVVEGIRGNTLSAYHHRMRAEPKGGSDKHLEYIPSTATG